MVKIREWDRVVSALRPLDDSERAELEKTLREDGVQHPVKVLRDGRIIDGHHRFAIVGESVPYEVIDRSEDAAFSLAIRLNTARRQLTKQERQEAMRQALRENPQATNTEVAKKVGVSRETVRRARGETEDRTNVQSSPSEAVPAVDPATNGKPPEPESEPERPPRAGQRKASAADKDEARRLDAQGMTAPDIADVLGFSERSVFSWLADDGGAAKRREQQRREKAAHRQLSKAIEVARGFESTFEAIDIEAALSHAAPDDRDEWEKGLTVGVQALHHLRKAIRGKVEA